MSLSTLELAQLCSDADDYMPDTCVIWTVARTPDDYGGWTEEWTDTYKAVSCRLAALTTTRPEGMDGSELGSFTRWLLAVPYNQAIDATMRVVHSGVTYEIEAVDDLQSHRASRHAYLRLVT